MPYEVERALVIRMTSGDEELMLRLNIKENKPRSLEEVGKIFGVTRERIRQIEFKAFEKIRNEQFGKRLVPFTESHSMNGGY